MGRTKSSESALAVAAVTITVGAIAAVGYLLVHLARARSSAWGDGFHPTFVLASSALLVVWAVIRKRGAGIAAIAHAGWILPFAAWAFATVREPILMGPTHPPDAMRWLSTLSWLFALPWLAVWLLCTPLVARSERRLAAVARLVAPVAIAGAALACAFAMPRLGRPLATEYLGALPRETLEVGGRATLGSGVVQLKKVDRRVETGGDPHNGYFPAIIDICRVAGPHAIEIVVDEMQCMTLEVLHDARHDLWVIRSVPPGPPYHLAFRGPELEHVTIFPCDVASSLAPPADWILAAGGGLLLAGAAMLASLWFRRAAARARSAATARIAAALPVSPYRAGAMPADDDPTIELERRAGGAALAALVVVALTASALASAASAGLVF